jgi:small-conductance mechanosensitive channel
MIDDLGNFFSQLTATTDRELAPWIIVLLVIFTSLLLFWILSRIMVRIGNRAEGSTLTFAWKKFRRPVLVVILLFDFILLKELFTMADQTSVAVGHIIKIAIIFCVTWLVIKAIQLTRVLILQQYDIKEEDNLKARKVYTQFRVLERILIFLVVLIALAVSLMTFEGIKRVGISLFASAGVAGIILGFAAQKLLGSILAGFQIALTQPIRLDDVVIVENEWGWIEEINLTYVVVRIWDKRRLIVPTTYFIEKPFQNWTRVSADILGTVFIYADYDLPVDKLREAFMKILKQSKMWDGNVGVMQVTGTTDRAMEIRALMSAPNSPAAWDLRVYVREKLIEYLQEHFPESLPRTRIEMEGLEGPTKHK